MNLPRKNRKVAAIVCDPRLHFQLTVWNCGSDATTSRLAASVVVVEAHEFHFRWCKRTTRLEHSSRERLRCAPNSWGRHEDGRSYLSIRSKTEETKLVRAGLCISSSSARVHIRVDRHLLLLLHPRVSRTADAGLSRARTPGPRSLDGLDGESPSEFPADIRPLRLFLAIAFARLGLLERRLRSNLARRQLSRTEQRFRRNGDVRRHGVSCGSRPARGNQLVQGFRNAQVDLRGIEQPLGNPGWEVFRPRALESLVGRRFRQRPLSRRLAIRAPPRPVIRDPELFLAHRLPVSARLRIRVWLR